MNRDLRTLLRRGVLSTAALAVLCVSALAQGKNPIILVPGLTGSELVHKETGSRIWFRAIRSKTEDLRLPVSTDLNRVRDNIIPGDIIRSVRIGPLKVTDVYSDFIKSMETRGGYKEEKWDAPSADGDHDSLYVFPYDWRLDNVENARRLVEKVEALKLKLKKPDLKFDIVAHSMGGLISRYAAMYGKADLPSGNRKPVPNWSGAKHFDRIILMGTPNEGSVSALAALLEGYTIGGLPFELPFLEDTSRYTVFTIPSAYQLLPAPGTLRVLDDNLQPIDVDLYDPRSWVRYGWSTIDQKDFAKEFSAAEQKAAPVFFASQLSRAKRLHEALTATGGKSATLSITVIGSDCRTAPDSVLVYREKDQTKWRTLFKPRSITRPDGTKISEDEVKNVMFKAGDGVVTRRSLEALTQAEAARVQSILDAANATKFVCEEHHKLAANSRIQDHIISLLAGTSASASIEKQ